MNNSLLILSIILAQISLGDFDARIPYRQPRYQRPSHHSHHHPLQHRQKVSKVPDKPKRRTFVAALLSAEVAFLEGILAEQQREAAKKQKPRAPNHIHPGKIKYQRPHAVRKPPPAPPKYVSKLDPFRMIAAPDLSKEAPQTASYEAPVSSSEAPEAPEAPSPSTSTVKYGELEHYNLGGYLPPPPPPPPPPAAAYQPAPPPPPQPSYQLPPVTPQAPAYEPPPPPPPPPQYKPVAAPAYEAPAPAPAQYRPTAAPSKELSPSPTNSNPHPHTFFHDAQADAVHDGEWPTVYYNTFQGNQATLIL